MRRSVGKFLMVGVLLPLCGLTQAVTAVTQSSSTTQTSSMAQTGNAIANLTEDPLASISTTNSSEKTVSSGSTVESENSENSEQKTDTTSSTNDSSIKPQARATIAADGYSEATTSAELETLLADTTVTHIRLTAAIVFDRSVTINHDITIDFSGLEHDFGTNHILISEIPKAIEFQNFKGTAAHPGGILPSVDGNAIIQAFATDWLANKYHFTGELKFTGSFDLWNESKIGAVYAPRAVVTLDGVSGVIDVRPVETGINAGPGQAYVFRTYQLNVINNSYLTGPYLGKFYGYLGSGDETVSTNTDPWVRILSGSKVLLEYDRSDSVNDEGEAIDTLPDNVLFEVSGEGSEFSVNTSINITNDNNRGIIQMRGAGSRVVVSDGGKITINTKTTGGFRLQGDSSQINVSSGGVITVEQEYDDDQPGNNGMRFVGKGLSLTVDGAGSLIDINKKSGRSSAVRFENGTQKVNVTNGGTLKIKNVGDGNSYANRLNQGNQAVQFYDSSGWLETPGAAEFGVDGEKSNIDIRADSGATIDATGDIDLVFSASTKTYLVMVGKTGVDKTGIISGKNLTVTLDNPTYFDFQNRRVGNATDGVGGWVFQGNVGSSLEVSQSEIALWRKTGATFDNFDKDPDYFSDITDLSITGEDLGTFSYSSSADLTSEFTQTNAGMKSYNRISANNQIPIIDNLRVPTNADKKIYGHVVVPEGVDAVPRDAWNDEVSVTLRLTYADTTKSPVDFTATTKGQTSVEGVGLNPWGEGEQGGLFEITVPNDAYLEEGDTIQVISAHKVKGGQQVTELDTAKTTVDIVPPTPAEMATSIINIETRTLSGKGEPGATAMLMNGTQQIGSSVTVDPSGSFTIEIPRGSLQINDTLELFLNDNAGEATAKGVINKPVTNNDLGNTNPSPDTLVFHDATFEPAPIIRVEGGLFLAVPATIDFGTVKADGLQKELLGTTTEQLLIYDQRDVKNEWTLTVKETKPFTSVVTQAVLDDVLYFASATGDYQPLNQGDLSVVSGTNTSNDPVDYSEYLTDGKGFKVVLDQSKQLIGDYSAEITWTLADVPIN